MPENRTWTAEHILELMEGRGTEANRKGMARYGIVVDKAFGVDMPWLRGLAKRIGKDHELALDLWASGMHEARILATIIADPKKVDRALMERWVLDFYSWDMCDQCCSNLFVRSTGVWEVVPEWCRREEEFVRRAGYVLIAVLAVKDKKAPSASFVSFIRLIEEGCHDGRNNVKKAVSWALRQIGKRDLEGHALALPVAHHLAVSTEKTARWIGKDAYRELNSDAVRRRLMERATKKNLSR
jgi:3-methyladenine DNA glycosylase AlkD